MNQTRLRILLGVMALLAILRVWDLTRGHGEVLVSEAVPRPERTVSTGSLPIASIASSSRSSQAKSERELDETEPRNAFAVRMPPPPPPPPAPPKVVAPPAVKPFVGPMPEPSPPPPAPPPFQVIGTWQDEQGMSAFLSGPTSTLQARVGDVLLSEYRVIQVDRQALVLRRMASNQDVRLAIPMSDSAAVATRP